MKTIQEIVWRTEPYGSGELISKEIYIRIMPESDVRMYMDGLASDVRTYLNNIKFQ